MAEGPREWRPEKVQPTTKAGQDLADWLKGVTILEGEGTVDVADWGPTYVAIVHEGGSYTPAGVIVVDQNPYHDLSNDVLETGFDMIREKFMKDTKHVKELMEEWGEEWEDILMESVDGKVWVFKNAREAAAAIRTDDRARKFIDFEDSSEDR
jgi:hypothetical protein